MTSIWLSSVYENGKPIDSKDYLKWNAAGPKDGEPTFVSGNPGSTQRLDTLAQLMSLRDVKEPARIQMLKDPIAALEKYSALGPEQAREAGSPIFSLQNSLKAFEGRYKGLLDPRIIALRKKAEAEFRDRIMVNAQWKQEYGGAWSEIEAAEQKESARYRQRLFRDLNSSLARTAQNVVEYVAEMKKPDGERLPGYHDAQLESLRFRMFSPAPVYKQMETANMVGALQFALEQLGANDPFVKTALHGMTAQEAAKHWIAGTKLDDPAFRRKLVDGGPAAVAASDDPMIALARELDPLRREMVKWEQDNVESVESRAGEQLGGGRFAVYGGTTYPDATFTLRLSYGSVAGYPMNGTKAPPFTTFYGLYDRATSFNLVGPFALPSRYLENRQKLDLATPLNFVNTCHITGGNSGSPVINRNGGEIIGLIFDGNIESLVGDFVYDEATNRAIAVSTSALTEALGKLYGAGKWADELMR